MSKKIILSVDEIGRTCWEEGLENDTCKKLGALPFTGAEIYLSASTRQQARLLSSTPENEETAGALCEWVANSFPRMPGSHLELGQQSLSLAPFKSSELAHDLSQEWVFYGGSFSPWHQGHQACLDLMPDGPKLIVVPDRNPWKSQTQILSWKELWKLAIHIEKSGHSLYPGFFMMNKTNPTVDWLPSVQGKKSFLIGDDNLCQIKEWKEHERLLSSLTCLYVAPRKIEASYKSLVEQAVDYVKSFGVKVARLDHHDYEHLSSTQMREKKRPS